MRKELILLFALIFFFRFLDAPPAFATTYIKTYSSSPPSGLSACPLVNGKDACTSFWDFFHLPSYCWNSASVGSTDCGDVCTGGDAWTEYQYSGCYADPFKASNCTAYYQKNSAVCSTGDKYNSSNQPVMNAGFCDCHPGGAYKTCCNGATPVNATPENLDNHDPLEATCENGSTAVMCKVDQATCNTIIAGGYKCTTADCGQPACTATSSLPNCNRTPSCSGACTPNSSNTCSTNNGTQGSCQYTTYSGGGSCTPAAAPNQPCTTDNCSSGYTCTSGTCTLATSTPTPTPSGGGGFSAPTVTVSPPGCINTGDSGSGITISWTNNSTPVSWVDLSPDGFVAVFYHKEIIGGLANTPTRTDGTGFNGYGPSVALGLLTYNPATTYSVRLFNGTHSPVATFNISLCTPDQGSCDSTCNLGVCGKRLSSGSCIIDYSCCHRSCENGTCKTIAGAGSDACSPENSSCTTGGGGGSRTCLECRGEVCSAGSCGPGYYVTTWEDTQCTLPDGTSCAVGICKSYLDSCVITLTGPNARYCKTTADAQTVQNCKNNARDGNFCPNPYGANNGWCPGTSEAVCKSFTWQTNVITDPADPRCFHDPPIANFITAPTVGAVNQPLKYSAYGYSHDGYLNKIGIYVAPHNTQDWGNVTWAPNQESTFPNTASQIYTPPDYIPTQAGLYDVVINAYDSTGGKCTGNPNCNPDANNQNCQNPLDAGWTYCGTGSYVTVDIAAPGLRPWIKVDGDVHSNGRIYAPGGPL